MNGQPAEARGGGAPPAYAYVASAHFARRLDEARRDDPAGFERIRTVMDRLLEHPESSDGVLHGEARGMHKKYVGRGEYRIAYSACRECRKANLHRAAACPECGTIPENSVVFHELYRKNERPPF
jgi:hypothetical protein